MADVTIDLSEAPAYFQAMKGKLQKAAKRGLVSAAYRGLMEITTRIVPSRSPVPVDRGLFRAGWKVDPHEPADGATLYNDEPHAVFIEFGVRGENVKIGTAMLQALAEWAMRKGLADDEDDAVEVAWAVAKAAQSRGFFNQRSGGGMQILKQLVDEDLPRIIDEEVGREVRKEIG